MPRAAVRYILFILLLQAPIIPLSTRLAAEPPTSRVSVSSLGEEANGQSQEPSISEDGRYVAFASWAANLVEGDTNGTIDVFVHDRQTHETTRVSVASDKTQSNGRSYQFSISGDGRYVVFYSEANNLIPDDTNVCQWGPEPGTCPDVFVHDRVAGTTDRVSVASNGGQADSVSSYPSISADGLYVTFSSQATNLADDDINGQSDVFARDRQTGQTYLVSKTPSGEAGNDGSGPSVISPDGRYIAFLSEATDLVTPNSIGSMNVFLYDRQLGTTRLGPIPFEGGEPNGPFGLGSFSSDGQLLSFDSSATNLVPDDLNSQLDVFLYDLQSNQTTRLSTASDGADSNGGSVAPSRISANGRFVVFSSTATNLVPADTNGKSSDIFLKDLLTGETALASLAWDNSQGEADSIEPAISADGRFIAFRSTNPNLDLQPDTNAVSDIFVRDTAQPGEPGIGYFTNDGFHVFRIDLQSPNLSFEMVMANDVTSVNFGKPSSSPREYVTGMVAREPYVSRNLVLAFNADYFGDNSDGTGNHGPEGLTVKNGVRFDGNYANPPLRDTDGNEWRHSSLSISDQHTVRIGIQTDCRGGRCLAWAPTPEYYFNTVGGGPLFIDEGQRVGGADDLVKPCRDEFGPRYDRYCLGRFKWTAVGVTQDGRYLIVLVSDVDKSMDEVAAVLMTEGAWRAIKLDGGASTQAWYKFANPQSIVDGARPIATPWSCSHPPEIAAFFAHSNFWEPPNNSMEPTRPAAANRV